MEAEAISSDSKPRAPTSRRPSSYPKSPGASADADMRTLVATIDKARRAAMNAAEVSKRKQGAFFAPVPAVITQFRFFGGGWLELSSQSQIQF